MELAWQRQLQQERLLSQIQPANITGAVREVKDLSHLERVLEVSGGALCVLMFYSRVSAGVLGTVESGGGGQACAAQGPTGGWGGRPPPRRRCRLGRTLLAGPALCSRVGASVAAVCDPSQHSSTPLQSCGVCKDVLADFKQLWGECRQQRARVVFLTHNVLGEEAQTCAAAAAALRCGALLCCCGLFGVAHAARCSQIVY